MNKPHLKQKQNKILKQYDINNKHTIRINIIKIVRIDGALNGNVDLVYLFIFLINLELYK